MTTIGFYAGSFDPITLGHLDVVEQGLRVFDTIEIGVGRNPTKKGMFSANARIDLIKQSIIEVFNQSDAERISVSSYFGSIMAHYRDIGATAIIRGLRQVSDFNDEFRLHGVVERVAPEIPMVYFIGQQKYLHVSSSTAKELSAIDEDMSWLVPQCVENALRNPNLYD